MSSAAQSNKTIDIDRDVIIKHPAKKANVNRNVFFGVLAIIAIFLITTIAMPEFSGAAIAKAKQWVTESFGWFYILSFTIFIVIIFYIACSSYGNLRLGPDHSQPEFSTGSWFAMLFTSGLGIGLMFFSVCEPVMHYVTPPEAAPQSMAAAQDALKITFFHTGIHAWAIYSFVGLCLGYFAYRHNLPLKIRSSLYPLIGKKIYGPCGDVIDGFASVATIFGVAASLGFGVVQINSGLNYLFDLEKSASVQLTLVVIITFLASLSVYAGIDKGVRRFAELNLILAILLLLFVFFYSPSIYLLQTTIENTGNYFSSFMQMTFNLQAYEQKDWVGGWTIMYWSWWIAWAPFVGTFMARISRGRTVREFILGAIFLPTGFCLIWMGFFGNGALYSIMHNNNTVLMDIVQQDVSVALFEFLKTMPLAGITSTFSVVLLIIFFVTSADSGALVVNYLTSKDENSPAWQSVIWVVVIAALATCLLLLGGLSTLQGAMLVCALPFTLIMYFMGWGVLKALRVDQTKSEMLSVARTTPRAIHSPRTWQQRLGLIMHYPHQKEEVKKYIDTNIREVFSDVVAEFKQRNIHAQIEGMTDGLRLRIDHEDEIHFKYTVVASKAEPPCFMVKDQEQQDKTYYQAEVLLREGGKNYDVMDWTHDDVIQDIIDQYERHLHFLKVLRHNDKLKGKLRCR